MHFLLIFIFFLDLKSFFFLSFLLLLSLSLSLSLFYFIHSKMVFQSLLSTNFLLPFQMHQNVASHSPEINPIIQRSIDSRKSQRFKKKW